MLMSLPVSDGAVSNSHLSDEVPDRWMFSNKFFKPITFLSPRTGLLAGRNNSKPIRASDLFSPQTYPIECPLQEKHE
jgi:hypothetical protein